MRFFLNSVPLSDKMYLGHMCTGRYLMMKVKAIVSADLSGMGNASGHPIKWSMIMIVSICLFLDVEVSHSAMRSIAILLNGQLGISII